MADVSNRVGTLPVPVPPAVGVFNGGQAIVLEPAPVEPGEVVALPLSDTFRGGAFVVVASGGVLDTSRDEELTTDPGWTAVGDVEFDSRRGARLRSVTGPATLTTPDSDYRYFDVAVDVVPLSPPDSAPANALIACLEHEVAGVTARVCLVRGAASQPNQLLAIGEAFNGDPAAGVAVAPDAELVTLRLVRNGPRVYGFIGQRVPGTDDAYTSLIKVLDAPAPAFGTLGGVIRLASRTETSTRNTAAEFTNYTVRSHIAINGRLLDNKDVPTRRQVVGNVPAATLAEVGPASVSVFGLFGVNESDDAFEYTLPAPRTVGNEVVRTLRTYQDPVVRDPNT